MSALAVPARYRAACPNEQQTKNFEFLTASKVHPLYDFVPSYLYVKHNKIPSHIIILINITLETPPLHIYLSTVK